MDEQTGHEAWVAVARIRRPRGRKGEVVAEALTDFPERFATLQRGFIESAGSDPEPVEIAEAWWHQEQLILRFAGVDSISQAEELRDRLLLVPRGERLTLSDHRYYVTDLIGCEVLSRDGGQAIGKVTGVERTGGVDLLQVERTGPKGDPSRTLLIPFAQEICPEIDVRSLRIVIDPPQGLLELNDESPRSFEA
ncbi:MAG TPA: ribosome maturation factor RimM [Terriglobia bacterium]